MIRKIISKILSKYGYEIKIINKHSYDMELYYSTYGQHEVSNKNFYNVGAGLFRHPAWTNIDYYSEHYSDNTIDISYNLLDLNTLPVESDSAVVVYSSHTIEHIPNEAAQNLFDESYRILKKGGILRLTTPNIDLYYRTLLNNDKHFWKWDIDTYSIPENMNRVHFCKPMNEVSLKQIFLYSFSSQTSELFDDKSTYKISDEELDLVFSEKSYENALDYCVSKSSLEIHKKYFGNHINWWNSSKLFHMLQLAGFKDIYQSAYGQSMSPIMRNTTFFDNTHPNVSIYYEAKK